MNRRKFLRIMGLVGAATAVPWAVDPRTFRLMTARAYPFAQSPTNLRKFVTTLPGLGPGGANNIGQYIPLATKTQQLFAGSLTDFYHLGVAKFDEKMHLDLTNNTHFWGYYDLATKDHKYLAGAIVAKRGTPVLLNVTNQLPNQTLIPIDPTIMTNTKQTVGDLPANRIATHLHGGLTPWFSDGTPFQWFDPKGMTGPSFMNVPGTNPPPGTATYYYPMDQSARLVWYHDHAIGITRTNAYAGIASALILTDDFESALVSSGLLPDLLGIPLVIQDKTFVAANILTQDSTWQWGKESDLWYPHVYEPNQTGGTSAHPSCAPNPKGRWDYGPCAVPPAILPNGSFYKLPTPASVVAEAFFDTTLVNGAPYPVVSVPSQRVRFRMLNGSQARFYHLNLYVEDGTTRGEPATTVNNPPTQVKGVPGPVMYQVGTEGGFLPAVAVHNNTTPAPYVNATDVNPDGPFNLLLAPAERADVIIDFNGVPAGSSFILYNDAPAPFPGGDPRNDYFTGDPDQTAFGGAPTTQSGFGPNTRTLLKIVATGGKGDKLRTTGPGKNWLDEINAQLQNNFFPGGQQPALLYNNGNPAKPGPVPVPAPPILFAGAVTRRQLTLNEDFDQYGRLIQTIGTTTQNGNNNQGLPTWGIGYIDRVTENPHAGDIEIWDIYNLTGDTHPIHFHLVNVQIVQRAAFDTGTPIFAPMPGTELPPDANELGWKETVRMNPGEVTTVIAQFKLPTLPASMGDPVSPRTGGHEYVWHCHILEHEEHDMMRPLVVT